jgi:hypothetical protein
MSSLQPLPLTGQACELEKRFSLGETVSFSFLLFLQGSAVPGFPHMGCWVASTSYGLFQFLPCRQRGSISSVHLTTSFVQKGCIQLPSCARICGSLPSSVLHSPGRLTDLFGWEWISYRAVQAGSRQRFCVHLCLVRPVSLMLAATLFLWFSALHYWWWGYRHTKTEIDLQRQVAVRGSVSAPIMVGPGTPRCLQISVILCVVF